MALIKLKDPSAWNSVPAGLIASGDNISLEVGAGGWDANSLDMTILPPLPWSSNGGQSALIIDSEIMKIIDISGADFRFYSLLPPDWNIDFNVGMTAYLKGHAIVNVGTGFGASVLIRDGAKQYTIELYPNGNIRVSGSTLDASQYPSPELFFSVNAGIASVWIFNNNTNSWDLLISGKAPTALAANGLFIGSASSVDLGTSFWYFLNWKSAIEATPYRTDSPEAEMGAIAVASEITAWPVVSGLLGQQYDIGAGFVQPGTGSDAEMAAELIGLSPLTFNYKVPMASDGVTPALLDINGGVMACSGAGGVVRRVHRRLKE